MKFPTLPPSLYPLFPLHPSSQPNTRFSCHVEKKERKDQAFSYNPLQESSLIVFFSSTFQDNHCSHKVCKGGFLRCVLVDSNDV